MENKIKHIWMMLVVMLSVLGASVQTVMAAKLGAEYSAGGIELGWILIGLALLIFILGYAKVISASVFKKFASIAVVFLVVGIALSFVNVEDTTEGQIDTVTGVTFDVDPTDPWVGGGAIDSTSWDDAETTCTIPIEITGSNNLDGNKTAMNFTITPVAPAGSDSTNLASVYFKTDYLMKYGGEFVLEENSGIYYANWTYAAGDNALKTQDYEASETMLLTETGWCNISYTFDSGTADCFSEELDSIGDSVSWHITFYNADNTWSKVFTITAIVVEV